MPKDSQLANARAGMWSVSRTGSFCHSEGRHMLHSFCSLARGPHSEVERTHLESQGEGRLDLHVPD